MARPSTAAVRLLTGEREPCRLATTANITLSGLQTIDAVLTEVADRVLVKNQTDATKNGIYTASEGVWYRASDARSSRTMQKGTTVHIQQGTVNAGTVYAFQTFEPDIGNDNIVLGFYTSDDIEGDASAIFAAAAQVWIDIIGTYTFGVGNHVYNAVSEGGADNTGVTSAKNALQAAANAAAAVGKPLWIPKGIYRFNAGESLNPPSGLRIIGAGREVAKFRKVTDEAVPIIYAPSGSNCVGNEIESLGFEYTGPAPAVTGAQNCAICFIKATDLHITDCLIDGKFYVGSYVDSGSDIIFDECKTRGFVNRGFYTGAGIAGSTADTMKTVKYNNCIADGLDGGLIGGNELLSQGRYGFNANGFGTGTLDDIIYQGCTAKGVYAHGFVSSERSLNTKLIGCHVVTTAIDCVCIFVSEGNGFRVNRSVLEGCTTIGGFNGIVLTGADYAKLTGCIVEGAVNDGIYIHNSTYASLVGIQSNNNGGRGINIDATALGNTSSIDLTNCTTNLNTGYGVFGDANSTWVKALNCTQVGNTAGTIALAGANSSIAGNRP